MSKNKRILFINPVKEVEGEEYMRDYIKSAVDESVDIDVASLGRGPLHLEYHYYEALIGVDMLHMIKRLKKMVMMLQ